MSALTLAQFQSRVKLACGNIPDAHPVIAEDMHTTAINNAPNQLIRENPDLFPEHHNNSWTVGPTVATDNLIALPENLQVLERVTCSRDAVPVGVPASDWTLIHEYPVAMPSNGASVIGMVAKPTTATGYPTICDRKGNFLLYNVTTQTGFTTYFRLYGTAGEARLTEPGHQFRMHPDFDTVIILYAAAEVLTMMDKTDRAMEKLAMAERLLAPQRSVVARERASRPIRVRIAGMPR